MRFADRHCSYVEEFNKETGEHFYVFTGNCIVTGKPYTVRIPGPELYKYRQGYKIQDAMPSVSASDREFLISGFSPEGWNIAMS